MAISILPPAVEVEEEGEGWYNSSDDGDADGDISMGSGNVRPVKRPRLERGGIVTPGEVVTDDPQWMRYVQFLYYALSIKRKETKDIKRKIIGNSKPIKSATISVFS